MKPSLFILACAAAATLTAALAEMPPPADSNPFVLIGPDYKKAVELPDTFFNPFKIQGSETGAQKRENASVTNESITEAIGHLGVSGILYGPKGANRVIIGDQVFEVGDELVFSGDKEAASPLFKKVTIILREIAADSLGLEVTPEGEAARRVNFSLRNFWRP